jgi:hypothetical protein
VFRTFGESSIGDTTMANQTPNEKKLLDEMKGAIPENQEGPFDVEKDLNEEELESVSGGECKCECGATSSCGGGGGGGRAAFDDV